MQSGGTAASGLEQTATLQVTECEREGCVAVGNGLEVRAVVSKQDSTVGLYAVFMAVYFVRDGLARWGRCVCVGGGGGGLKPFNGS